MSSSRSPRRRIVRRGEGVEAATARLLVEAGAPAAPQGMAPPSLDEMIEKARQEGYQQGYEAATTEMAAAEAAGRAAQLRRVADALVSASEQVSRSRHELVKVEAAEAVELACQLAEAFLQRELAVGRPALDAVARALDLAPEEENLVVRVNPDDPIIPEELAALAPDGELKVIADPRVEPGGCVLQAGSCHIDAQLGTALDRVRQVFEEFYPEASQHLDVVEEVA